jgi:glycosyltransferase involved in cell wall biosynthesis
MLSVPDREGRNAITDYVSCLVDALRGRGIHVTPVFGRDWGPRGYRDIRRTLRDLRPDVLHIQHPVSFHHRSYVPQVLSLRYPGVTTLHGGSRYGRFWGKVSIGPFLVRSRHVIFTTDFERDHALGWARWLRRRSSVVPIGANIPARPAAVRRPGEVAAFGLIRPGKGHEEVIEFARLARDAGLPWRVRIIGQVPETDAGYAARLRASATGLPIDWAHDLDHEAAARALGEARVAYVPFPDGASERRGSLLACLAAGAAVITNEGPQTPPGLAAAVRYASTPAAALAAARELMHGGPDWERLSAAGQAFAARFSWDGIAQAHEAIYRSILR